MRKAPAGHNKQIFRIGDPSRRARNRMKVRQPSFEVCQRLGQKPDSGKPHLPFSLATQSLRTRRMKKQTCFRFYGLFFSNRNWIKKLVMNHKFFELDESTDAAKEVGFELIDSTWWT
jgi:hypothetical protein